MPPSGRSTTLLAFPLGEGLQGAQEALVPDSTAIVAVEGVVVSAAGFEQALRCAPASVSVVGRERLMEGRIRNLLEAVQEIPGVDIDGADARSNKTGNRGASGWRCVPPSEGAAGDQVVSPVPPRAGPVGGVPQGGRGSPLPRRPLM